MYKKLLTITMTIALSLAAATTAFAGTWQKGVSRPNDWWYDNGDGTWKANGWHWIDGNGDGIAECYYFDHEGWMAANTTTPDGYQVDANGAWVQNGAVQTKNVGAQAQTSASTSTNINTVQALDGVTFSQGAYGWRLDYAAYSDGRTFYLKEDGTKAAPGESFMWQGEMYTIGSDWMSERPLAGYGKSSTSSSSTTASSSASSSSGSSVSYEEVDIDEYEERMIELVNEKRAKKGLSELEVDSALMEAAGIRAEEIVEKYGHARPGGGWGSDELAAELGYQYRTTDSIGEICVKQRATPEEAVQSWVTSSGHKAIMFDEKYKHTTVGAGVHQENGTLYYVMLFGD